MTPLGSTWVLAAESFRKWDLRNRTMLHGDPSRKKKITNSEHSAELVVGCRGFEPPSRTSH